MKAKIQLVLRFAVEKLEKLSFKKIYFHNFLIELSGIFFCKGMIGVGLKSDAKEMDLDES